jgi:hypothetical protein
MQLDPKTELPNKESKQRKKIELMCKHCEHSCHCSNGGQCSTCACANCEHNALDDFYNRLDNGKKEIKK